MHDCVCDHLSKAFICTGTVCWISQSQQLFFALNAAQVGVLFLPSYTNSHGESVFHASVSVWIQMFTRAAAHVWTQRTQTLFERSEINQV